MHVGQYGTGKYEFFMLRFFGKALAFLCIFEGSHFFCYGQ
jgi:hypothetical protein